jgi:hypothetical protein
MKNRSYHRLSSKIFGTLLFVVLLFSLPAQSIINGSFEEWPDSCSVDIPPIGWSNFSVTGGPDQRGLFCEGSIIPYEGDSYMSLLWSSGGGFIRQGASQFVSGLIIGQTYTISFYVIPCDYYGYNEPINMLVYIDSSLIYVTPEIDPDDDWTPYFTEFTATDTHTKLAFQALEFDQGSSSYAALGIDAVSLSVTTGLNEPGVSPFHLFPNPAGDVLHIAGMQKAGSLIKIIDLRGQIFLTALYDKNGIDISMLTPGIYFITTDEIRLNKLKFVKQ